MEGAAEIACGTTSAHLQANEPGEPQPARHRVVQQAGTCLLGGAVALLHSLGDGLRVGEWGSGVELEAAHTLRSSSRSLACRREHAQPSPPGKCWQQALMSGRPAPRRRPRRLPHQPALTPPINHNSPNQPELPQSTRTQPELPQSTQKNCPNQPEVSRHELALMPLSGSPST